MNQKRVVSFVLRLGLAFSFLYPPFNAYLDPYSWVGFFPSFAASIVPAMVLLHVFGIIEIIFALWLLSGYRIFAPSLAMAMMLLGIVVFNLTEFQILFRDISLAFMAIALAVLHYPQNTKTATGSA